MEAAAAEFASQNFKDLSNQPWYIRWGIAVLGCIAGLICILIGAGDLITFSLVGLFELLCGVVLIAFEATIIAKAFNFEFCGLLIGWSEKASPLMRVGIYGVFTILVIVFGGLSKIFIMIPTGATAAAYFVLYMGERKAEGAEPSYESA